MGVDYGRLRVLVADDFSNFRSTVNGMLGKLGVSDVATASNGEEVLEKCRKNRFDIILCDYDLGPGRNGQQVLEELRHHAIIDRKSAFIIVSADAAKEVVMAAYDCEPDDYLMKPITAKMLQMRIARLLLQRQALASAYIALEQGQKGKAIAVLIDISISEGRYALAAQKLLGELFVVEGELNKAEKLYTKALEARALDWARLGLAKVKHLKGEHELAGEWLEKIIEDNPLYLPAYDCLADNWLSLGDSQNRQTVIKRSVDISPKSILRQKQLAEVAESNKDLVTALSALRNVVRLGELSCHATPEDNLSFARVAARSVEGQIEPPEPVLSEALETLDQAKVRFPMNASLEARSALLEGQAMFLGGKEELGKAKLLEAEGALKHHDFVPLNVALERVSALQTLGETEAVDALVEKLLVQYKDDPEALNRLDALLAEPASENNKEIVATVNREGIELYNQNRYDDAIACFETVLKNFPKHVGIHLNIVQSLVGKLKSGASDEKTVAQTQESLKIIGSLIEPGHENYARFERLKAMAARGLDE